MGLVFQAGKPTRYRQQREYQQHQGGIDVMTEENGRELVHTVAPYKTDILNVLRSPEFVNQVAGHLGSIIGRRHRGGFQNVYMCIPLYIHLRDICSQNQISSSGETQANNFKYSRKNAPREGGKGSTQHIPLHYSITRKVGHQGLEPSLQSRGII